MTKQGRLQAAGCSGRVFLLEFPPRPRGAARVPLRALGVIPPYFLFSFFFFSLFSFSLSLFLISSFFPFINLIYLFFLLRSCPPRSFPRRGMLCRKVPRNRGCAERRGCGCYRGTEGGLRVSRECPIARPHLCHGALVAANQGRKNSAPAAAFGG